MPAFDVTIENQTYRVEIPWLNAGPLPLVVNGQALELCLSSAPRETQAAGAIPSTRIEMLELLREARPASSKPVMAEWHASLRAE